MQLIKGHASGKTIKKAIFRHPVTQNLICALVWAFIRFVYLTGRVTLEIDPAAQAYMRGGKNAVFAFWHARMMVMPMICPPGRRMHVMISGHHDGLIIARAMRFFGFGIVQGSSRRGGREAARGAIEALERGDNVSITPDGPKGPAMKVQPGAAAIARNTGLPVIPVAFAARPCRRFRSWDRFVVALPFSRIRYQVGAPIFVAEDETGIRAIEEAMTAQVARLEAET
jgi:lysophospholipid acyltransferase (LPLAT)-like uncharacterized protein